MPQQFAIKGQVSIAECTRLDNPTDCWKVLIMGPTGAGKSAFIESLSGVGQSLGISKNQLAGFTQDVLCYELKNAVLEWTNGDTWPIYLIDTPGFSDSKISEIEIINKVKFWMKDQGVFVFDNILYLTPITDTRVPGSKLRTIKMIQSLLRPDSASTVTIVTTMWDMVCNPQAEKRARGHFEQLQADIWKDLVNKGARVVQFHNNRESTTGIVRDAIEASYSSLSPMGDGAIIAEMKSAPLLYHELLDRISNCQQEIKSLRCDYLQLMTHPDPLLESVICPRLHEVTQDLGNFLTQLVRFGEPPAEFDGVPEQVIYEYMLSCVTNAKEDIEALQSAVVLASGTERELSLWDKLQQADRTLAYYLYNLVVRGEPPPGLHGALKDALAPPVRLPPPTLSVQALHPLMSSPSSPPPNTHTNPTFVIPDTMASYTPPTLAATPEGSGSRVSMGDRINRRLKTFKYKITSRGPHP